ncbi:2'-5' RNA ligase family protein [Microlunatus lacustris]
MTQSVELTVDAGTDRAVRELWSRLADAGLPSEQRATPSPSHQPHVTLWAGDHLDPTADAALPGLVAGLDLTLRLGGLLAFGPRRGSVVLARQVVLDRALLDLQTAVATRCGADPDGHFGPGRWTPHVTLARRVRVDQLSAVVQALGHLPELVAVSRGCRRWDSEQRVTCELTGR